jgi:RNA polymerase sigma factor (sigma-70 family)
VTPNTLAQLFQQHMPDLQRFLTRRVGNTEAAADLVQETFLRLLQFEPARLVGNPRALLFTVASHLAIDHLRRDAHQIPANTQRADAVEQPDPRPSIEHMALSREQIALLKRAIAELPPRCREVFILHKFKHLSYSDIASKLGISRSTVVKHMIKALEHCKRCLDAHAE